MITLQDQIAEAQRELALRRSTYPKWLKAGKLDEGQAKWQILVQQEIVRTLMRLDAEQRQLSLFGQGGLRWVSAGVSDSGGRFVAGTPPESFLPRGRILREKNASARRLDASAVPQGVQEETNEGHGKPVSLFVAQPAILTNS